MFSAADARCQIQVRFGMYDMLKASRPATYDLVFAALSRKTATRCSDFVQGFCGESQRPLSTAEKVRSSRQLSRVLQFALGCCVRDTCLCLISIVTSECLTQPLTYRRNPSRSLIKLSRSFARLWLVQPELSLEIRAIWQWYECRHLGR